MRLLCNLLIFYLVVSIKCYVQTPYQQSIVTAPYQVSLFLVDNYNPGSEIHNYAICSATIIHPLFCVTSAACVHYHISSFNISRPLSPSSLYIIGGNFSDVVSNIGHIQNIKVHPNYNAATSENDIAILTLQTPFDLVGSRDYQWVQLADNATRHSNCFYNLYATNSTQSYPFARPQKVSVVNSTFCNQNASNQYTQLENIDLCSYYQFTQPELCQSTGRRLTFSYDRGAALICDNKLAGILSIVLPANRSNSSEIYCNATSQTNAYFTNTALYLDWIRSVIVSETSTQTIEGVPVSVNPSVPAYQTVVVTNTKKPAHSAASLLRKSDLGGLFALITCLFAYGSSR